MHGGVHLWADRQRQRLSHLVRAPSPQEASSLPLCTTIYACRVIVFYGTLMNCPTECTADLIPVPMSTQSAFVQPDSDDMGSETMHRIVLNHVSVPTWRIGWPANDMNSVRDEKSRNSPRRILFDHPESDGSSAGTAVEQQANLPIARP